MEKEGVLFFEGVHPEKIDTEIQKVVYTEAIIQHHDMDVKKVENPEFQKARELGIETRSYPEALGEIVASFSHSIAIAGTHGKSTTASMM